MFARALTSAHMLCVCILACWWRWSFPARHTYSTSPKTLVYAITGQEKLLHSGTVACLWASACSIIDHLDELLWQARSVSAVWAQKRTEKHNLHWDFPFSFSHVACDRRRSNSVEHAKKDVELTNPSHLSLISLVWALLFYLITCIWIKLPTASNFVRTTCVIV